MKCGPLVALALLLAVFVASAWRLARPHRTASGDEARVVIRFAHSYLEAGVREAFDELARDYERLHPGVRVEQLAVPERVYLNWIITQFVGGTAPDLVQVVRGLYTDHYTRYLSSFGDQVDLPNPYNDDTAIAGGAWRDSFLDGMAGTYNEDLQDYYTVSVFPNTNRFFYNRDLLRELTGRDVPPSNYDEFLAVCVRIRERATELSRPVVAVAGSRQHAPFLLDELFRCGTQRFGHRFDPRRLGQPDLEAAYFAYLAGDWQLTDAAPLAALRMVRETGLHFQTGFTQLGREDALFAFIQGRAVMLTASSFEAHGITTLAEFPVGVAALPLPTPDHPIYGRFIAGPAWEKGANATGGFGLTQASAHPKVAQDFLYFITSQQANRRFVARTGLLPAIVGVEPTPAMAVFAPRVTGESPGFDLRSNVEVRRLTDIHLGELFGPDNAALERFAARYAAEYGEAMRASLVRPQRLRLRNLMRNDLALEAARQIAMVHGASRRQDAALVEAQNEQELIAAHNAWRLAKLANSRNPAL